MFGHLPDWQWMNSMFIHYAADFDHISGGRIEVLIHPSNAMGDERSTFEMLSAGSCEYGAVGSNDISTFFPKYFICEVPYVFSSQDDFWKFWNGPGKDLSVLLSDPAAASLDAIHDGVLFNYNMFAYLDGEYGYKDLFMGVPAKPIRKMDAAELEGHAERASGPQTAGQGVGPAGAVPRQVFDVLDDLPPHEEREREQRRRDRRRAVTREPGAEHEPGTRHEAHDQVPEQEAGLEPGAVGVQAQRPDADEQQGARPGPEPTGERQRAQRQVVAP